MQTKNLILVGGGGHCKSVIEVAESVGYKILGILEQPQNKFNKILSYDVIGTDDDIPNFVDKAMFVITIGQIKDSTLRRELFRRIINAGGNMATLIASTAYVSKNAIIGRGTVVMHNSFINASVEIGENCIINTFANIEHDSVIGDFCHISTGAIVNGNCFVGNDTFIGSQSVLLNGISIANGCIIAAGTVVNKTINNTGIYFGNPAKIK